LNVFLFKCFSGFLQFFSLTFLFSDPCGTDYLSDLTTH